MAVGTDKKTGYQPYGSDHEPGFYPEGNTSCLSKTGACSGCFTKWSRFGFGTAGLLRLCRGTGLCIWCSTAGQGNGMRGFFGVRCRGRRPYAALAGSGCIGTSTGAACPQGRACRGNHLCKGKGTCSGTRFWKRGFPGFAKAQQYSGSGISGTADKEKQYPAAADFPHWKCA